MIENIVKEYSQKFNAEIQRFFELPKGLEKRVVEAMLYSLNNGGKRMRPFLVYETAKLFGKTFEETINTALSLECMHSFSLIHDDLPAIDNDDLRRGKPTCHKQFDEATAILAGDGLLTYSFELLSTERQCSKLVKLLANAAGGHTGMIAGEMLDIITENAPSDDQIIKHIEEMKTGRLITYAIEAGCVLGEANESETKALKEYSRKIGIAFQIADDILDVEGDVALVGKALHKDQGQGKLTFVGLYGLEKAKQIAKDLINEAKELLNIFGKRAQTLQALADYIINRKY